jgi:response regulator RpfG family c-di-GMP phosphodiesterase
MASGRAYRKKIEEAVVLDAIRDRAGTHFDPQVVETLLRLYQEGRFPTPSAA